LTIAVRDIGQGVSRLFPGWRPCCYFPFGRCGSHPQFPTLDIVTEASRTHHTVY